MPALLALLLFIGFVLVLAAPYVIAEWHRDRNARIIARQIELTNAIHAELGAAASPLVTKPAFGPWRVRYVMPAGQTSVEHLVALTHRVLRGSGAADIEIVFTPRRAAHPRAA